MQERKSRGEFTSIRNVFVCVRVMDSESFWFEGVCVQVGSCNCDLLSHNCLFFIIATLYLHLFLSFRVVSDFISPNSGLYPPVLFFYLPIVFFVFANLYLTIESIFQNSHFYISKFRLYISVASIFHNHDYISKFELDISIASSFWLCFCITQSFLIVCV